MAPSMDMRCVTAIIILNSEDGSRVFAKYYSAPHHSTAHNQRTPFYSSPTPKSKAFADAPPQSAYHDLKSQRAFEKGLLEKTAKQTADVILYDNRIVLYKSESDVMMYVVGGVDENEIMLYNVILSLRDSLHLLFKQSVDKRTIIENYDLVSLAIDEIVDDGVILETDPTIIVQRVSKAPTQDVTQLKGIDLSEQGMNNLAQFGKAKLGDWLRQGL
ncbi:hypothetical protein EG329_008255 [Mollisiaceae sp. DMI_Dod_QoI]|nr:hypothetical protein EG329_008255 [Helotiales sp. DMI_Dod_QoI]